AMVSFLAGIMPALLISKARPIDVVNGKVRLHNKMFASKIFIVVQNVITIVLISLVLTMELQMRHVQNRDVGCRTKDLYFLDASFTLDPSHNEALANELQALPCVSRFGTSTGIPTKVLNATYLGHLNDEEDKAMAYFIICDTAALNMLEIPILSVFGDTTFPQGCFMTQSMLAELTGLPYGEINVDTIVKWQQGNFGNEICGVVGDFMVNDVLHVTDESFGMVMLAENNFRNGLFMGINFRNGFLMEIKGDHKEAKEAIGALYKKYVEEARGLYMAASCNDFVDVIIHQCLEKLQRRMRLMELFMLISVILSLLGLVAMSTHFASEREKTIAIRKIFGGTMESEVRKNLRDYVIIILIANVIAIPIGVWLCGKYLEDFAYRIDLHPWIFIVTVLISFAIAIGSVLWQIVSVAKVNPTEALKKE
ncbi:MAG: ABC transporter permease, partial [bacterium]|nr:ABC transporter permease [Candidatus Limimorpha equi]